MRASSPVHPVGPVLLALTAVAVLGFLLPRGWQGRTDIRR
jgi:hypothetical protein